MAEIDEAVGLAEAAYDNDAEWPDELVFRRGDILQVLDKQPAGGLADGWWLCADKDGKRGIAPANRLKMIHTFGQGQERVITPRRFGDVFLYNHRLFNDEDDDGEHFFRQPPLRSLFGSVYNLPTALRNLYLLHASDHPFIVPDKIGNKSSSHDFLHTTTVGSAARQPVVRTVPIRMEGRQESAGIVNSPIVLSKSSSSSTDNAHRSRSPPPPPPQRRHFNLSGPLLLSSLAPPAATSSTSSSGSDEERAVTNADQSSPNNGTTGHNGPTKHVDIGKPALLDLNTATVESTLRASPASFYDSPSSLLTASSLKSSPAGSSVRSKDNSTLDNSYSSSQRSSADSTALPGGQERYGIQYKKDVTTMTTNGNTGGLATYDVPRSLKGLTLNHTQDNMDTGIRQTTMSGTADVGGGRGREGEGRRGQGLDTKMNGGVLDMKRLTMDEAKSEYKVPSKPALLATDERRIEKRREVRTSPTKGDNDPERLSVSSMDSKGSDYQELLGGASELRINAVTALDTLMKLLENLQSSVDKLSSYSETRNWRRKEYLESHIMDIRSACRQTIAAVKDFFDFSSGAFFNVHRHGSNNSAASSTTTGDGRLTKHLAHLVRPIGDSLRLLMKLQQSLDVPGWLAANLAREGAGNDSLDQLVAVAKQVPHDARQVASFVQGNIYIIFPASPSSLNGNTSRIMSVKDETVTAPSYSSNAAPVASQSYSHVEPVASQSSTSVAPVTVTTPSYSPHVSTTHSSAHSLPHPRTVRFADNVHISTGEVTTINGGGLDGKEEWKLNGKEEWRLNGKEEWKLNGNEERKPLMNGLTNNGIEEEEIEEELDESAFDDYDYIGERLGENDAARRALHFGQRSESNAGERAGPKFGERAGMNVEEMAGANVEERARMNVEERSVASGSGNGDSIQSNGTNSSILSAEDRQILQFYSPQVENHIDCLSNAIDDFLSSVEQNQPPKVFVGHSKFVILGAHKLVYIGDSVAQCLQRRELSEKVKLCANNLCDVLKYCVTTTKQAALQYPSIPCVQAMVDSMVNVSHAAYELKLLIQEAANL